MDRLQAEFDLAFPSFRLNVDLDVPAQGVTAVYGPTGSGKTTLLRCLAGLERAPRGVMRLGQDVWQDEADGIFVPVHRRAVGYVFQELRLFPHLTVRGNLNYGWHRTPSADRRLAFDQVVALLELEELLRRRPDRLSGGEQQRVAIGRALLTSPRLLLFDEPLSSLDAQRKRDILPFIQRLDAELKIPIVYVSHSLNEILQLTRTLVLMQEGHLLAVGPIGEVLSRLDLRRSLGQHMVGAVLDTRVIGHDPDYGLTHLEFPGGRLSVPYHPRSIGTPVRVHILSRDVSLVVGEPPARTSILNIFPGTISDIGAPSDEGQMVEVKVDIGSPILASITRKSLVQLSLQSGQPVFVQIKAVALNEDLGE